MPDLSSDNNITPEKINLEKQTGLPPKGIVNTSAQSPLNTDNSIQESKEKVKSPSYGAKVVKQLDETDASELSEADTSEDEAKKVEETITEIPMVKPKKIHIKLTKTNQSWTQVNENTHERT